MKSRILLSTLLGVLALATFSPRAEAQRHPVGFVDVQKVIFEYKKTREISERLQKRMATEKAVFNNKKRALQVRIEALQTELPAEVTGKERNAAILKRVTAEKDIALDKIEIELGEKIRLVQLEKDLVDHMKKVYAEIKRECEAIARDQGLRAIYMVNDTKVEGNTRSEVISEILVRPVLWHHPEQDLTNLMIERLNR